MSSLRERSIFVLIVGLIMGSFPEPGLADDRPGFDAGVNLAGAEFGRNYPGLENRDYYFPTAKELGYYALKKIELIRLPILWERVQPRLFGRLDKNYMESIDKLLETACAYHIKVILDLHNFGRYGNGNFRDATTHGDFIGSTKVPMEAFTDLWKKLALRYKKHPGIYGYDLMNEPHDEELRHSWKAIAQSAVSAIRELDSNVPLFVEGACWSKAASWQECNQDFLLKDPAGKLFYEAHQYFDRDSVEYPRSYDQEKAYPNIGVDRIKPFIEWLRANHQLGIIGEYAVPGDDPRWLEVMERFLLFAQANCISTFYWAGGGHWGNYKLSIEPQNGEDARQMKILQKYVHPAACGIHLVNRWDASK